MATDLKCPECNGHLTVVEEGQTEVQVWEPSIYHVVNYRINRPFVSCDCCEWVFDAHVKGGKKS